MADREIVSPWDVERKTIEPIGQPGIRGIKASFPKAACANPTVLARQRKALRKSDGFGSARGDKTVVPKAFLHSTSVATCGFTAAISIQELEERFLDPVARTCAATLGLL